jgi:hypothetical protein
MKAETPSVATKPDVPPSGGSTYRSLTPVGTAGAAAVPTVKPTVKPVPAGVAPSPPPEASKEEPHPDPTRFGDWEVKGRCIDF